MQEETNRFRFLHGLSADEGLLQLIFKFQELVEPLGNNLHGGVQQAVEQMRIVVQQRRVLNPAFLVSVEPSGVLGCLQIRQVVVAAIGSAGMAEITKRTIVTQRIGRGYMVVLLLTVSLARAVRRRAVGVYIGDATAVDRGVRQVVVLIVRVQQCVMVQLAQIFRLLVSQSAARRDAARAWGSDRRRRAKRGGTGRSRSGRGNRREMCARGVCRHGNQRIAERQGS